MNDGKKAEDIRNKEDLQMFITDTIHGQETEFSFQDVRDRILDVMKNAPYRPEELEDVVDSMLADTLETFIRFKLLLRSGSKFLARR